MEFNTPFKITLSIYYWELDQYSRSKWTNLGLQSDQGKQKL